MENLNDFDPQGLTPEEIMALVNAYVEAEQRNALFEEHDSKQFEHTQHLFLNHIAVAQTLANFGDHQAKSAFNELIENSMSMLSEKIFILD